MTVLEHEKKINKLLNLAILNINKNKYFDLKYLENFLIYILYQREMAILHKKMKEAEDLTKIIEKYKNFKSLILDKIINKNNHSILYQGVNRIVCLITHNCQLRCKYCSVSKLPAVISEDILAKTIDLIFQSDSNDLQFQFFGGEPLLNFDLVQKGIERMEKNNKNIKKILTTNGLELNKEKVDYLSKKNVLVELSIDGTKHTQLKTRQSVNNLDYFNKLENNLQAVINSQLDYYVIMVVMPQEANKLFDNFKYLYKKGIKNIQLNYALGVYWPKNKIKEFFFQLDNILNFLDDKDRKDFLINLQTRTEPVVLNSEVTVDCDGQVFLETGICLETDFQKLKQDFYLADIDDMENINLYSQNRFYNFYRLVQAYSNKNEKFRKIILNNIFMGHKVAEYLSKNYEA
jgi:molybdenum cofactor biosynthesis enzyme MoaA